MENVYVDLLNNLKLVNMDYLSNVFSTNWDQTEIKSLVGDGENQLNREDVVNFFAPVSDAILTQLKKHDYISFKMIKKATGMGCMLKTSDTVYKFEIPNIPGRGHKIIMHAVRSTNPAQMSFAHVICDGNVINAMADILMQLDTEDEYHL